jgi:hypothetical protein
MKRGWDGEALRRMTQLLCIVRLDRLVIGAVGRNRLVLPNINGFQVTEDFRPRRQGKIATYGRVPQLLRHTEFLHYFGNSGFVVGDDLGMRKLEDARS